MRFKVERSEGQPAGFGPCLHLPGLALFWTSFCFLNSPQPLKTGPMPARSSRRCTATTARASAFGAHRGHMAVVVNTVLGSRFGWWVNSPPVLGPVLVDRDWDVHYDLDFEPWPY